MNNRQKAKHFKRLYEQSKTPVFPVTPQYYPLVHYVIARGVPSKRITSIKDIDVIKKSMLQKLVDNPALLNAIKVIDHDYSSSTQYRLDFWLEANNERLG